MLPTVMVVLECIDPAATLTAIKPDGTTGQVVLRGMYCTEKSPRGWRVVVMGGKPPIYTAYDSGESVQLTCESPS